MQSSSEDEEEAQPQPARVPSFDLDAQRGKRTFGPGRSCGPYGTGVQQEGTGSRRGPAPPPPEAGLSRCSLGLPLPSIKPPLHFCI